jgi:taurine---2-oxoglutarate transaminase
MNETSLRDLELKHVLYGWQRQDLSSPAIIDHAEHIFLWDIHGKRYIDFCSGQFNVNVGYGNKKVLAAMKGQLEKLTYVAPTFATEPRLRLASAISECMPGDLQYVFFTNSGAEAIETAIKVARAVTGRSKIYSAWQSYHGATAMAAAISGDPRRLYVEPSTSTVVKFHYASCYRCPFGQVSPPTCHFACLQSLRRQILLDGPETVAAVVLEPIVGTSGLYVPPKEFVRGIRDLCDEHGILLIFDETMCGWGRSGKWFASEHFDVVPDILTTAKGITSAYVPLGAVIMSPKIRNHFLDVAFVGGLTTEAHTLACAAAIANIEVYKEEHLVERSATLGEYLLCRLCELKERHPSVGDVRGKGLFACLELTADREQRSPLAGYRNTRRDVATQVCRILFDRGLFLVAKWDFIFVAPPLVITKEEIDEGIGIIDHALDYTDTLVSKHPLLAD